MIATAHKADSCLCACYSCPVRAYDRGWFNSQGSTASLTGSDLSVSSGSSLDMGPVEAGGAMERWGAFGPRPNVQKPPLDPSTEPGSSGAGKLRRELANFSGRFRWRYLRGSKFPSGFFVCLVVLGELPNWRTDVVL